MNEEIMELHLFSYHAVAQKRSIRRAIRRGKVLPDGSIVPSKPFNHRKHSPRTRKKYQKMVMDFYNAVKHIRDGAGK